MSSTQAEPELTDEQILAFEQQIKDQEAQKIPLVCQDEPLSKLEEEFKDNDSFLRKIKNLSRNHRKIRKCRGDGNCFFRAFAFSWFESALHDKAKYETALAHLKNTPKLLEKSGFQTLAFEDFYDVTLEQFEKIPSYASDPDLFLANFQSEEISNAIVMHLRFVTSAYLRVHADDYEPFLVAEMISIDEFCAMHVEAFGRESDHLQIIALTKALDTPVQVIYLDGSDDAEAAVHEFWPNEEDKGQREPLQLIYRPGHYDILY
ncbi:peptidase C65 Otubain-domain-containing protein [Absidia repens]|uniref:ubiquitinyl hydrolase 1 n=1 Tax=Absidia repens TaxID=90262 RepID=A0A1X2IXJ2_9FUNG|nr:peptidase C65 Otubain-domain-containing protein [Absidia repens]